MYAEERQRLILQRARDEGRVEVAHLATQLEVTPETVRRDLTRLERLGHLRRVHGGAIPVELVTGEAAVSIRRTTMATEKDRIAKAAVDEVPQGGAILLDAGTTTSRLAALLPPDRDLTVVTNALDVAVQLADRDDVTVLMIGGRIRGRTHAAVDAWAATMLQDLRVGVAFMATNGLSVESGLTTPDPAEAEVKRLMMAAARRIVLLADHTKAGQDQLVRFGRASDLDTWITDSGVSPELRTDIEEIGVQVVTA